MRIAAAQIDTVVGDIARNLATVRSWLSRIRSEGVDLVVFPELTLTGYPLLDLVHREDFVREQRLALDAVVSETAGIGAIVGFVDESLETTQTGERKVLHNAAAVIFDGTLLGVHRKILLPEYDVFFEHRYFTPGTDATVINVGGVSVGVQICEDLWDDDYSFKVTRTQAEKGAQVIVNLSASPFHVGKKAQRQVLIEGQARGAGVPVLFCNQVGSEDGYEGELVFDGNSVVCDCEGKLIGYGASFEEDLVLVDIDPESGTGEEVAGHATCEEEEAFGALVCGLKGYAGRAGFKKALLGLSGGIDSSLVAVVAKEALGAENVLGVSMPSRYSSEHSRSDAEQLAENLGIEFRSIPIESVFQSYLDLLEPSFVGLPPDVTEENLQARVRGGLLMALSNKTGAMLLSTGNKTEVALGYCTLYGDMSGGLMVIADVSKERVYAISRWINESRGAEVIPVGCIEKPPSAELREDQVDPFDYAVVSPLVDLLVEKDATIDECVRQGFPRELAEQLNRLVNISEYKRRQAAPGIRITERAFGVGRRMPIV